MSNRRKKQQYIDFDVEGFLDDNGIAHAENVKNVGSEWIGVETCPMCGTGGYHFAINKETKVGSCWVCSESCNPFGLIKAVLGIDNKDVGRVIRKYSTGEVIEYKVRRNSNKVIYPPDILELQESGKKYLRSRHFNPDKIAEKYGIKQTGPMSYLRTEEKRLDFRFRILIPIIMDGQVVSYTARDITGQSKNRYENPNVESCMVSSSAVYNIDTVKDECIIVEGITDVWRMGDGIISLQGVNVSALQLRFLADKKIKKAYIMFDPQAEETAFKLANALTGLIPEIYQVTLPDERDPAELSDFEAFKIKHELLGGKYV